MASKAESKRSKALRAANGAGGITVTKLAKRLGISRMHAWRILEGLASAGKLRKRKAKAKRGSDPGRPATSYKA